VVPFGREGAADRAARAFASALPAELQTVVEDIPGEGGLAGVRRANALAREGRPVLLLATPSTHILLPERLGAAAAPDARFAPLADLGRAPNVLLVSPRLGVATLEQLVARAKREQLVYASAGTGQTIHLCTAYFCELAGVRMQHRPYDQGSAGAYADLIAGRVHVYFDNLLGCREFVARGDAVPLAVSARSRNRLLPEVPTLAECGYPAHALDIWFGVFGTTQDAILLRAIEGALASPALAAALAAVAGIIAVSRQFSVSTGTGGGTLLLEAIAAAVIGGASLFGGEGTVTGVILGAALIQVVRNGVVLLGLTNQNQWQFITIGAMILVVLLLDYWRRRRVWR